MPQSRRSPAARSVGYSIPEAIEAFSKRYEHLRETRPYEFTVSREDYGRDFYS